MADRYYRLRVRNAEDTADAFAFTSVRGGSNPYIAGPPSGDGQEVDLLTGSVRTGAYQVTVVDAVVGTDDIGTLRSVTQYLYDSGFGDLLKEDASGYILLEDGDNIQVSGDFSYARPSLLSRRAYIEVGTDGSTFPTVWQAGYITNVQQSDAITYTFSVSDTRRVEQTKRIFTWSEPAERVAFPQRGCIWGGPVIDGFGAQVGGTTTAVDSGGWEFAYKAVSGEQIVLQFVAAYLPPSYNRVRAIPNEYLNTLWGVLKNYVEMNSPDASVPNITVWQALRNVGVTFSFPNVIIIIEEPGTANVWRGTLRGFLTPQGGAAYGGQLLVDTYLYVTLESGSLSGGAPSPAMVVDRVYRVRAVSREVTPDSPLYFDLHPVDVASKLYDLANIPIKSGGAGVTGTAAWAKVRLGPTLRLAARITESQNMAEFLEKALFGPFGFATRTNLSGEREFIITRRLPSTTPTVTFTDADIRGDEPPVVYDLDESTAVTGVTITQRALSPWVQIENSTEVPPADNLVEQVVTKDFVFGDTTTYSTRVITYELPGMAHDEGTFQAKPVEFGLAVVGDIERRFVRGAPIAQIPILGTSAVASAQIGDEVLVTASYFPNRNYRIGEAPSVGPRVMQIVRRDETPEGPTFKLVDSGLDAQPTASAVITLAASTQDPRRRAQFTVTNANVLNTLGDATVSIQWATGASAPADDGTPFIAYNTPNIPTAAVLLPPVIPGSTVYVRARVIQKGLRPTAWTAWTSATLTAWTAPATVTTDYVSNTSAQILWSVGTNTEDQVEVYIAPGSVAPTDWTPFRINTLSAGTTSTTAVGLTASTAYIAGVAFRDVITNTRSSFSTAAFTTLSGTYFISPSAALPTGKFLSTVNDARFPSGVALGLYAQDYQVEIQRAPQVSGSPGTYATIAIVDKFTDLYIDPLPVDGKTFYYRIQNISLLQPVSGYQTLGGTIAANIPPGLTRPAPIPPSVAYNIRLTATQAIVTWGINGLEGGLNDTMNGGGIWSGNLTTGDLIFPPDYTSSPTTLARAVGSDTLYTIGARRDGVEDRVFFTVPQQ